jgi:hypothetical protein
MALALNPKRDVIHKTILRFLQKLSIKKNLVVDCGMCVKLNELLKNCFVFYNKLTAN